MKHLNYYSNNTFIFILLADQEGKTNVYILNNDENLMMDICVEVNQCKTTYFNYYVMYDIYTVIILINGSCFFE